jgi:alkylation response protein AidB-like acyl-CoA dehydrogenase
MTFDLSSDQQAARDRARAFAGRVLPHARDIDRTSLVADEIAQEGVALLDSARDETARVVMIEEVAAASGAVAILVAAGSKRANRQLNLSGLRGAAALDDSPRSQLVLAAAALGLGRRALEIGLDELRAAAGHRGRNGEKPHWLVADVATELDAARLLTYKASQAGSGSGGGDTVIAMARLLASAAAQHAIDAALRLAGADGFRADSELERLARDIRAIALVHGTEEQLRTTAAEGLLPQ